MAARPLFQVDFENALKALRIAPKEVRSEMNKSLRVAGKLVVADARERLPSGMRKGKAGLRQSIYSSKGIVLIADGSDRRPAPYSWAGAAEGGRLRHPVFPKKGEPRKKWRWAPKEGYQHVTPPMRTAFNEHREELIQASHAAIQRALDRAFSDG